MLEEQDNVQENFIDVEKVNLTPNKIKLIYLGILALGIKLESMVIPISKSELDLVVEYLSKVLQKNEELIRRACSLLEQIENSEQNNYYGIVKEYLDNFFGLSESEETLSLNLTQEQKLSLALKVLTDLLFYSSRSGQRYLHKQLQCL
ncbi:DUF3038 domain-containing protein [Cyanobacterium aponinum UTEX 3222]|uniref:Uncharacterized protein n=3 Tax=Cyanobacterium aponinum TaxID=379064 RepID=K9Z1S0_CYAAP|nr:DUF3038 domain-containing protein [Cyanobacterium aponinum]WRL41075.1 DUF3038 domain-containing protein [Cyanobacterium aponinum UTEX 3222]AFZ53104.1 hypothetical protein Cyan10605_0974 [Cyanobacterium aponinum PCC 10605]MBD2395299.1 DUF3038 domain-containing protein [Cyanobacterium aponinum FACHB-4101]MTF40519.1 DUF3038 domain-containing protein [Cyanobacterium aponinum 0216]PHV61412.1 hypothetical protein CSQ80_15655 [Cyanobacterium aponinum IPPAS B-1201]